MNLKYKKIQNILVLGALGSVANATLRTMINKGFIDNKTIFHLLDIAPEKDIKDRGIIKFITQKGYKYVYHEIDISDEDEVYYEFTGQYFIDNKINTILGFIPDEINYILDIADTAGQKMYYIDASLFVSDTDPENKEDFASSEYSGFSSSAQEYAFSKYKNILGFCSCGMNPGVVNYFAHLGSKKFGKDGIKKVCVVEHDDQRYEDEKVLNPFIKHSSWCVSALYEETSAFGVIFRDFYNSISVQNFLTPNTTSFTDSRGNIVRGDIVTHEECHLLASTYGAESTFIYNNPYSDVIRELINLPVEEQQKYKFEVMTPQIGKIIGTDEVGVQLQYKDGKTVYVFNRLGTIDDICGTSFQVAAGIVTYLKVLDEYEDNLKTQVTFCENVLNSGKEDDIINLMGSVFADIGFKVETKISDENWTPIPLLEEVNGDKDWRASDLIHYCHKTNSPSVHLMWKDEIKEIEDKIRNIGGSPLLGLVDDFTYSSYLEKVPVAEAYTRFLLFLSDPKYSYLESINMDENKLEQILNGYKITPLIIKSCFVSRYDTASDLRYDQYDILHQLIESLLMSEKEDDRAEKEFKVFQFFKYSKLHSLIMKCVANSKYNSFEHNEREKFVNDFVDYYKYGIHFPFSVSALNLIDYNIFYKSWLNPVVRK